MQRLPMLPSEATAAPRSALGRWLQSNPSQEAHGHHTFAWHRVLWLTGVDYFSTLAYQAGIALLAAGALAPTATLVLVVVTLFGALPIYREVAGRSFGGEGSISMLERLIPGWPGKLFVLSLMGFAATDFVITMTLSAADAAEHAVHNPALHGFLGDHQLGITLALLAMLAVVFLRGFREAVGVAMWLAVPYLGLNLVVIGRGALELWNHPELVAGWRAQLPLDPTALILASVLGFPKLALGLSGFETGVTVMPLITGDATDPAQGPPPGRIRATRHLLLTAAAVMSFFLLSSSFVTTCLIAPELYQSGGEASGRALAWMAHHYLGPGFGSVYDIATILILWFAGSSAMAALLSLIPRYLPRFGMAPAWTAHPRPLILVIFAITVLVTVAFDANVEAQGGAYATGVLALILSGSVAVTLANWSEGNTAKAVYFGAVSAVFAFTFVDNVIERPDGIIISSMFIAAILVLSGVSRWFRATEFRVQEGVFADEESAELWPELVGKKVNLVPLKSAGRAYDQRKRSLQKHYKVSGHIAWVHVELGNDRSRFDTTISVRVRRRGPDYLVEVENAVAVANTLAWLSELIDPVALFLGLTRGNVMTQALKFLLWGEGETGILVYQILIRYWQWTPEDDVRPRIFLMSE